MATVSNTVMAVNVRTNVGGANVQYGDEELHSGRPMSVGGKRGRLSRVLKNQWVRVAVALVNGRRCRAAAVEWRGGVFDSGNGKR